MRRTGVAVLCVALLGVAAGCALLPIGPAARFEVTPVVLYAGDLASFDATASRGSPSIAAYDWEYGDGSSGAGMRTEHRFEEPGTYEITLTVTGGSGRVDRLARTYTVYVRTGTELLRETFDEGADLDASWPLDASWASGGDARLEFVGGSYGTSLRITSDEDRWHRRWREVLVPPLRTGQRLVFRCDVMTAQTQYDAGFWLFPLRASLDGLEGALPFLEYSSEVPGVAMIVISQFGTPLRLSAGFSPQIYRWSTYRMEYHAGGVELYIDDALRAAHEGVPEVAGGGRWLVVLGDESHELRCHTYFDNIVLSVEE